MYFALTLIALPEVELILATFGVSVFLVVPSEESLTKSHASSMLPNLLGNSGLCFKVLKWLSEKGLSRDTPGRERDFVTPNSAGSHATGFDFIDNPRSE